MSRQTSREAYNSIVHGNLLSRMRLETYELLFFFGPMTASELLVKGRQIHGMKSQRDNYQKRLGELRDSGVAYEVRERKCYITGRHVIEWDVTDKLPEKLPPRPKRQVMYICSECFQTYDEDIDFHRGIIEGEFSLFDCKGRLEKWIRIR